MLTTAGVLGAVEERLRLVNDNNVQDHSYRGGGRSHQTSVPSVMPPSDQNRPRTSVTGQGPSSGKPSAGSRLSA
jgi:hypothetical protein